VATADLSLLSDKSNDFDVEKLVSLLSPHTIIPLDAKELLANALPE
jgi:hypothetical protein